MIKRNHRAAGMFVRFLFASIIIVIPCRAQFRLPAYEEHLLSNGITVYIMEKKDVPLISFSVVFSGAGGGGGLPSFTAEALKFGTIDYSKNQIDSVFNFYGSSLNTYVRQDYSGIYSQFMESSLEALLPVIKAVIINPGFPEDEIIRRKQRWLAELDLSKESPGQVIGNYFNRLLFGDESYGLPLDGTRRSVETIDRQDIESFYNDHYGPENCAIAVVGDFDSGSILEKIENYFAGWGSGKSTVVMQQASGLNFTESRVYLINKDNARETTFMIGGAGVAANNKDQVQIDVINTILGGRFTSWLNDQLRVSAGYTYGARSRFSGFKTSGTFYISTFTPVQHTEAAIDLALKTYRRLFETGIDEAALASAKNYVKGQFPPEYETSGSLADFLTRKYVYGFGDSLINGFEKAVDEMTTESAAEIIKKYFPEKNLQFVLIGKAGDIRNIAVKYGRLIEKNITEDGF